MSDAASTTDPEKHPWLGVDSESEELGITVEYGRLADSYIWVEVAWCDDPPIERLVAAPTAGEFEAELEVAAYQLNPLRTHQAQWKHGWLSC